MTKYNASIIFKSTRGQKESPHKKGEKNMLRQTVEFEGREISLHENAYIDQIDGETVYTALGHDVKTGHLVRIVWEIESPNADPEDQCNWNRPESVNVIDDDYAEPCRCYICGEYELYEHVVNTGEEFICCGCIDAEDTGELPREITDLAYKIHDGRAEMTEENRRILTEAVNAR